MRFSEAMRRGAKIRPQVSYVLFGMTPDGQLGSCALGAGYEASGAAIAAAPWSVDHYKINREFPILSAPIDRCPECEYHLPVGSVYVVVAHLNNDHEWTRERIADWVETIEDRISLPNHQQEGARQEQAEELSELVCA